jgi:heme/copper-type cytochrome/quinol oxidase subunit 2
MDDSRKSVKKWVILLILPIALLVIVALAQIIVRFALAKTGIGVSGGTTISNTTSLVLNLFSSLAGILGVIGFLLYPLWITLLIQDSKKELSKTVAVVLAVFFGLFSWLYTYKDNARKFWINLCLTIVTIGYWSVVAWIWAIIDNANKPEKYYKQYRTNKGV